MVHNGIEYGDMQLIYDLSFNEGCTGMTPDEMHEVSKNGMKVILIAILLKLPGISCHKDEDGQPLVDKILIPQDKGNWKMDCNSILDEGILTLIGRLYLQDAFSFKEERVAASKVLWAQLSLKVIKSIYRRY